MKRKLQIFFIIFFGTFASTALALELFLRLFFPMENIHLFEFKDRYVFNRANYSDLLALAPVPPLDRVRMLYLKWFNQPVQIKRPFLMGKMETNSQGLRGIEDYKAEKPNGKKRVLAVGNSFTFGWPVEFANSYPQLLEKSISGAEFINCSVIGATSYEVGKFYHNECAKFEADLVILQMSADISKLNLDDLSTALMGPDIRIVRSLLFSTGKDVLQHIVRNNDGIAEVSSDFFEANREKIANYYTPHSALYNYSHIYRLGENSLGRQPKVFLPDHELFSLMAPPTELAKPPAPQRRILLAEKLWPLAVSPILGLAKEIQASGKKVVILITRSSYFAKNLQFERPELDYLKNAMKSNNIQVIDFKDYLTSIPLEEINSIYFNLDQHLNPKGYKALAAYLKPKVEELLYEK